MRKYLLYYFFFFKQKTAYEMFSQLMAGIKSEVLSNLFRSTTNLMAFEQFLSTLPVGLNLPGLGGPIPAGPSARSMPRR